METDFFAYSRRKIEKDKEEGHFEAAHNREMALRCFVNFLGKEELSLNELTPELMVKFEEWLNTKGRKQSTTRLYLYQISSVYNIAVKEGIVPKLKLLKGVRVALPAKKGRELLSVYELRRMRYAALYGSLCTNNPCMRVLLYIPMVLKKNSSRLASVCQQVRM